VAGLSMDDGIVAIDAVPIDGQEGDLDEQLASLLRRLVASRARAAHPAGTGRTGARPAEVIDLR